MFSFLLGKYLRVELLNHIEVIHFAFWEAAKPFSKVAVPFYIFTGNEDFQLQYIIFSRTSYGESS